MGKNMFLKELSNYAVAAVTDTDAIDDVIYLRYESCPSYDNLPVQQLQPLSNLLAEVFYDIPKQVDPSDLSSSDHGPKIMASLYFEVTKFDDDLDDYHYSEKEYHFAAIDNKIEELPGDAVIIPMKAMGAMVNALSPAWNWGEVDRICQDKLDLYLDIVFQLRNIETDDVIIDYHRRHDDASLSVEINSSEYRAVEKTLRTLGLLIN